MSWITTILQLYSQEADLFGNVIVKRINIRLFDLLARYHYILNLPRISLPVMGVICKTYCILSLSVLKHRNGNYIICKTYCIILLSVLKSRDENYL